MSKKKFFILILVLFCSFTSAYALAQIKYPEKPIEALIQYPPGASGDISARILTEALTKILGQPTVVINKVGGAGSIAGNTLAKAKPDGYTIGIFSTSQPTPEYMMSPERFTYKSKDLQAVSQWAAWVPGLFVRYDAPWNSAKELEKYAKENPDKLKWGHSGRGGMWWIIGDLFMQNANVKTLDVPFEGDAPNMIALLGNHIDISVLTCGASVVSQIQAKKLRPLFVATEKRYYLLPEVPTAQEAGYMLGIPSIYFGVFVPKETPRDIVSKLNEAIRRATEDPQFKEKMNRIWFPILYRDTKDFEDLVIRVGAFMNKYSK